MEYIQYLIIILILVLVAFAIIKSGKKDYKMEANKLVEYLGGKDNIVKYEVNISRFLVEVKDTEVVNKEAIQKMGAQGIVEIDNELKIIFGDDAKQLKKCIDDLK
jgi:glucose-like phosphotransferase system IIB component